MNDFDKRMATEVIEDAFKDLDTPYGRGVVSGLCGAFYMCGLLNEEEWNVYLKRIPAEHHGARTEAFVANAKAPGTPDWERLLN